MSAIDMQKTHMRQVLTYGAFILAFQGAAVVAVFLDRRRRTEPTT